MDLLMNELTGIGLNQPTTSQGENLLYIACGSSDNEVNFWSVNTLNTSNINDYDSSASRNVLMELGGSKTRRKNKRRKSKTLRRK
jgi:WD40 repeat protein